jgi:hypothetical protein
VIAEEFIAGQELTASILGDVALPLVRIEAPQGNYDYQNKYFTDDVEVLLPGGCARRPRGRDPRRGDEGLPRPRLPWLGARRRDASGPTAPTRSSR